MVLNKIGEYLTTIKVNGTEKVSQLQNNDEVYKITDSQGVTLKLNGEIVDNYSQTGDSTYDVNAYGNNVNTKRLNFSWSVNTDWVDSGKARASFTVGSDLDGYYGGVSSNGDFYYDSTTNNDANWSGTFNQGDTFSCEYEGVGSDGAQIENLSAYVDIPIDPQVEPNGSTKS
jgi:hypothetical protein